VRGVALGKPGAWNGIQGASVKYGEKEIAIEKTDTERADVSSSAWLDVCGDLSLVMHKKQNAERDELQSEESHNDTSSA
jgi:hypothetical protein